MPERKVVLITGSARRIGAQMARRFHHEGYNVLIHYNQSDTAALQLAADLNNEISDSAFCLQANLVDLGNIAPLAKNALSKWGRVDVLINNASLFFPTPLKEADQENWDTLINSNLRAPYFLCQQLSQELQKRKGAIVNIADIFSDKPKPEHSIYCIAKAGNVMLTKSMAIELAPHVRVNGISPGAILWPEDEDQNEITNEASLDKIPLKGLGGADAIADCAYYLVAQAHYTTGQIVSVDGGKSVIA